MSFKTLSALEADLVEDFVRTIMKQMDCAHKSNYVVLTKDGIDIDGSWELSPALRCALLKLNNEDPNDI